MTDLTVAEQRKFTVKGIAPYRVTGTIIEAGVTARVIVYPAGSGIKDRVYPDDDAKLRAAVRAQVTAADVKKAGG